MQLQNVEVQDVSFTILMPFKNMHSIRSSLLVKLINKLLALIDELIDHRDQSA